MTYQDAVERVEDGWKSRSGWAGPGHAKLGDNCPGVPTKHNASP